MTCERGHVTGCVCRYKTERPEDHCHTDLIREVAESVSIPVIAKYVQSHHMMWLKVT